MTLSIKDTQILLYEGGYIDEDFVDSATPRDFYNLKTDLVDAAIIMNKEIDAGNFITVDKQFVMNNVGMFRGIHDAQHAKSPEPQINYVINFSEDMSLIFDPKTTKGTLIEKEIRIGLEPLKVFDYQFSDEWQYVPSFSMELYSQILNWNQEQAIQLINRV